MPNTPYDPALRPETVKSRSSLKLKTVLLLLTILVGMLTVSIGSAYYFFWPPFQKIERQQALQNGGRVQSALQNDLKNLRAFVTDWANWDDSYTFIYNSNPGYVRSNLTPETFWQNGLSGIAFIRENGDVHWSRGYDFENDELSAFPEELEALIQARLPLPADGMMGVVELDGALSMLAARPIRNTALNIQPRGALVMLKPLDENYLDRLRRDLRLYLEPQIVPTAEANAGDAVWGEANVTGAVLDGETRSVWFDWPLLNKAQHAVRVYVQSARDISSAAKTAFFGNTIAVMVGTIAMFLAVVTALEQHVVDPLVRLSRRIVAMGEGSKIAQQLDESRTDEIGLIAHEVNRMQDRIMALAVHDHLTGLPNRRLFDDRLEHALEQAERTDSNLAVIFIDLDGFKPVNDRFGHQTGDELLVRVATRFSRITRGMDTLARFGGDEFAFIADLGKEPRRSVDSICSKILEAIEKPFQLHNHMVRISASIGCAIYPEQSTDATELIRLADEAMYAVKAKGKGHWLVHGEAEDDGAPGTETGSRTSSSL